MDYLSEQQALSWIEGEKEKISDTLIAWSELNSGSYNLDGLAKMRELIAKHVQSFAPKTEVISCQSIFQIELSGQESDEVIGDALLISGEKSDDENAFRVLLSGHMDTVFPKESAFQKVKYLDDNTLNGPGVADMKGGLLVMFYALHAFSQTAYSKQLNWQAFINADEEIGSMGSKSHLARLAKKNHVGLVFEPSMSADGTFAGARKGSGKFSIDVTGQSAHAGRDFNKGKNAICLLSKIITDIDALNYQKEGLTLNIGLVGGGSALNVVPEKAVCKIDIRFEDNNQKNWVHDKLLTLCQNHQQQSGYKVRLLGDFYRQPKPMTDKTTRLFKQVEKIAKTLNLPFSVMPSGGCCDGNNLQSEGLAVIDTLGVVGGHIHSDKEFMKIDSLVYRAQLTLKLLILLAKEGLGDMDD